MVKIITNIINKGGMQKRLHPTLDYRKKRCLLLDELLAILYHYALIALANTLA